ncbi:MAG: serine protein kinase RIO [Thermoplasmata archaeon]|nr:serine protein kinase RIO [Thermoplasmata archaeon]
MPRSEELVFPRRKDAMIDRRVEGQQRKLVDEFFDHRTLLTVSRLITQGQFESLDYPIATGKEGGVFRASGPGGLRAVKVYRIGNAIFRHLPSYAIEALRRETSVHDHAGLIYAWTRREHSILRRLTAAKVLVPEPYGYLRNVLVMDFIGSEGIASPRLHDVRLADPTAFYDALVVTMQRMVREAKLVHGDLSPYNVLVRDQSPVLIDVAQAIETTHPQALELLERDVTNFAKFFERLGVDTDAERLLESVAPPPLPARED